jgi:hypothetical protein
LEVDKKERYKKLIRWLLVDLAVAAIIFALLLYRPSRYDPRKVGFTSEQQGQVEPYMTHLSSELYNGTQLGEPFELEVLEQGINQTIARWSAESEGVLFTAPEVLFLPGSIVFMGVADVKSAQFVVTISIEPNTDEKGMLNLQVAKVKIGAMNITPLAKMIAKKMYQERIATVPVDMQDLRSQIAASLLSGEPFDPIFNVDHKKVRLDGITVEQGKLILHFVPA